MMTASSIEALNRQFAIQNHLYFGIGDGGMPFACIKNQSAAASICLLGAMVVEYQPAGSRPVLQASRLSNYQASASIRGGIPVCWPWFSWHPDPLKPPHGFVYDMLWEVVHTAGMDARNTMIEFKLTSSPATLPLWEHEFELRLVVIVGRQLDVSLIMSNPCEQPYQVSGALHSYYAVSDIRQIDIAGLGQTPYIGKTPSGPAMPTSAL